MRSVARRHGADCSDAGFILYDVVIGAIVLTLGLVGTTLVLNQSQQSSTRVDEHAEAVALATSLLSEATAYGCGAETGLSLPGPAVPTTGAGYPSTATLWHQCAELYAGDPSAAFPGVLGDPVESDQLVPGFPAAWTTSQGGTRFAVSYRATWVGGGAVGGCPGVSGRTGSAPVPIGETRTVTVGWRDHGAPVTFSATVFGGVPVDAAVYSSPDAGGILVTSMAPGSMARLEVPVALTVPSAPGTVSVDRAASTGAGAGCAWFPFLRPAPEGTYTVRYFADGDASGGANATTPPTLSVKSGSVTSWAS